MNEKLRQKVLDIAAPLAAAQGLEVWGLDFIGGPRPKVCLYIDSPGHSLPESEENSDNPENVFSATIDQCERVSRQLGLALEVEDLIPGPWVLEVSSPGLERKFFRLEQLPPYRGDLLECVLREALAGRKVFRGRLMDIQDDALVLELCSAGADGEILSENSPPVKLPWQNIRLARRIHIFAAPAKPGKHSKKNASPKNKK